VLAARLSVVRDAVTTTVSVTDPMPSTMSRSVRAETVCSSTV
jgi:hypothetical protein